MRAGGSRSYPTSGDTISSRAAGWSSGHFRGRGATAASPRISRTSRTRCRPSSPSARSASAPADSRVGRLSSQAPCRAHRAALVVAKVDRLARSVAFLAKLLEADVNPLRRHALAGRPDRKTHAAPDGCCCRVGSRDDFRPPEMRAGRRQGPGRGAGRLPGPGRHWRGLDPRPCRAQPQGRPARPCPRARRRRARSWRRMPLRAIAAALAAEGVPTAGGAGNWTAAAVARIKTREARAQAGRRQQSRARSCPDACLGGGGWRGDCPAGRGEEAMSLSRFPWLKTWPLRSWGLGSNSPDCGRMCAPRPT